MSIKDLFNQFVGAAGTNPRANEFLSGFAGSKKSTASSFPGGMAGGLAAGGIVSLLMGNKKARKYVSKAATVGGVTLLGGAAYQLYRQYQKNHQHTQGTAETTSGNLVTETSENYQLTLIKAMIAAAKADGHIDDDEKARIFETIDKTPLSDADKALIFDLLEEPISVRDIVQGRLSEEQKVEVYYVSCLVGEVDHPAERKHLDRLAIVLDIPDQLKQDIEKQASVALID